MVSGPHWWDACLSPPSWAQTLPGLVSSGDAHFLVSSNGPQLSPGASSLFR